MAYRCTFSCRAAEHAVVKIQNEIERHPVAFANSPPLCPECDRPMQLGSFILVGEPIHTPPRRKVVRRPIGKGSLPLFTDFSD